MKLDDWLLFIGAGASRPAPTNLPTFSPLSIAVLESIGWESCDPLPNENAEMRRWQHPGKLRYPDIGQFDTASEVLFGTLTRYGVKFTNEVCRVLSGATPNAIHSVAAQVLQSNGLVWTPNIDDAVERACTELGFSPHRTGRAAPATTNPLMPLASTAPGTYVKFHGTAEAPMTVAFTDRQLIAPLLAPQVKTLAEIGKGKVVVFYGYQGADADLADLLDQILTDASEIHWFEPDRHSHHLIVRAFPTYVDRISFVPDWRSDVSNEDALQTVAASFLKLSLRAGARVDEHLAQALELGRDGIRTMSLNLKRPSGATQAQLVERFGVNDAADDRRAWSIAWRDDLFHLRIRALVLHLKHGVRYSLYHSGSMSSLVLWLADRPGTLKHVQPRPLRNYLITRACALLLRSRDRTRFRDFVNWSVAFRSDAKGNPFPTDLYYQSQANRYSFRPSEASASAVRAIDGLQNVADAERLAGALYEAGDAALYLADFNAALDYAFQLRYRRGRYAIARWQAWGAWLETIALAHLGIVDDPMESIEAMKKRFDFEQEPLNRVDARTAELLVARVRLAQFGSHGLDSLDHPTDSFRTGRYLDDFDLVRADISIAMGDLEDGFRRYQRVFTSPATPVSRAWAQLGLAEIHRIGPQPDARAAAEAFEAIAIDAHQRGAWWLEAQSLLGLHLMDETRAEEGWQRLARVWPINGGIDLEAIRRVPDVPARILWTVTL